MLKFMESELMADKAEYSIQEFFKNFKKCSSAGRILKFC